MVGVMTKRAPVFESRNALAGPGFFRRRSRSEKTCHAGYIMSAGNDTPISNKNKACQAGLRVFFGAVAAFG
jgi:hypothetical protein